MRVRVAGRSAATAATANHVAACLWNPHATIRLRVYEIAWCKTVATVDGLMLVRTTTRGTPASTVTPVMQNETDYAAAPVSGALLDLGAYSAQPTIVSTAAALWRWNLPAAIGSGFIQSFPEEMEIPPGNGLAVITPAATILQPADISFAWAE